MAIQTATLADYTPGYRKIIGYGSPGAGKTHWIQYLPRPFVFDFDRGLETLASLPDPPKDLQFMPRSDMPDLTHEQVMLIVSQIAARPEEFGDTLVIDTLTAYERQLLAHETERMKRKDGIPWQEDYRPGQVKIMQLLTALLKLPMHLYLIMGEDKLFEARTGALSRVQPDLTPRLTKDIPRMFDEIYYFQALGNRNYQILTEPDGVAYAKSRSRVPSNLSPRRIVEFLFGTPESDKAK